MGATNQDLGTLSRLFIIKIKSDRIWYLHAPGDLCNLILLHAIGQFQLILSTIKVFAIYLLSVMQMYTQIEFIF